jgi:hypothetical protein
MKKMKGNPRLCLLALLSVFFLLNGCAPKPPDQDDEPAATVAAEAEDSPPYSIGSESSHLIRPTLANPGEKVEPTRAISAETITQLIQANSGPQTNGTTPDQPIHRHTHVLYLMIIVRR